MSTRTDFQAQLYALAAMPGAEPVLARYTRVLREVIALIETGDKQRAEELPREEQGLVLLAEALPSWQLPEVAGDD